MIDEPRARYRQLADELRAAITRGDYPPGAEFPPESALVSQYGLDRRTVRAALQILRSDGLIHVQRGRGTVVNELPVITSDRVRRQQIRAEGSARGAFGAELAALSPRSESEVSQGAAPDDVAEVLGAAGAVIRVRRMFAHDTPVQMATSWYPLDIAGGTPIAEQDPGPGGSYSRLADLGHGPVEFTETVAVRSPEQDETRFLQLDQDQRVLSIRRIAADAQGRVVEVNDIVMPAHQFRLVYRWQAE